MTQGFDIRPRLRALRASRPAATSTAGFDVLVQLVIAAISTAPSATSNDLPPAVATALPVAPGFFCARSSAILRVVPAIGLLGDAQRHAVLRTLGAREARLDGREVELEDVGVVGLAHAVGAPQALRLGIGLDQRDLLGAAAGESR